MTNKYLYNDKELDDEADLDWYDYGFRSYDPQVGRFPQLDPLTWDYPELTNYQYASNDPVTNIDLDGLEGFNAAFTGAGTAANNLGEVTVKAVSHVAPAVTNSIAKTAAGTLLNLLLNVGSSVTNAIDKAKTGVYWFQFNARQESARTGTTLTERILKEVLNPANAVIPEGLIEVFLEKAIVTRSVGAEVKVSSRKLIEEIKERTTVYERVMSEAELEATRSNNLLRGGREGENFFSLEGTISNDAKRAQQRLGLDENLRTHKVQFTITDPSVNVTGPRAAKAGKSVTAGGGMEFSTKQTTPIKIRKVTKLKNTGQ